MQKILVTGGLGFLGSHTVVALVNAGFEVVIIDNLSNSHIEVLSGLGQILGKVPEFFNVDMTNREGLNRFFENNHDIAGVIHFAAYKAVGESVSFPLKYYSNNLGSLINLLENMVALGLNNLVFSSSCTVYGEPDILPVTERSAIKKAESPYGNTKIISEQIIEDIVNTGQINAVILRYFNPIGAHTSAHIGELPIGIPNNLVPVVTQTAAGLRDKVVVYGNDYDTPDGSCIRDYIHVTDLANAHLAALNRMMAAKQKSPFEVFNVGTGRGYSVLEVLNAFIKISGVNLPFEIGARRPGDISKIYADTSYANQELGWKAEEDLETMIGSAWAWQQQLSNSK